MRVLGAMSKESQASIDSFASIKKHALGIGLSVALLGYALLLINFPHADSISKYPEPVNNLLYEANFPGARGAPPWAMRVHTAKPGANCADSAGSYYRVVSPVRCQNLLLNWDADKFLKRTVTSRCNYFYESLRAAELGSDVSYIVIDGQCVPKNPASSQSLKAFPEKSAP